VGILLSVVLALPAGLSAGPLLIDDFGKGFSSGWEKKVFRGETVYTPVFRGETVYTPVIDEGRPALKAESRAAASALIYRISLDPKTYPRLSWSWKIGGTIRKGDERTKAGDDYAARVYVVFPSVLFWRTRAVNYIWANRLPRGPFSRTPTRETPSWWRWRAATGTRENGSTRSAISWRITAAPSEGIPPGSAPWRS
jgi:hypothetical protein